MYLLTVSLSSGEKSLFYLYSGTFLIGSQDDCDIQIPDNTISRRHASLSLQKGLSPTIEDLDSLNGIFLNGAPAQKSELKDGDRLMLGTSTITVEEVAEDDGFPLPQGERLVNVTPKDWTKTRTISRIAEKTPLEMLKAFARGNLSTLLDRLIEHVMPECSQLLLARRLPENTFRILAHRGNLDDLLGKAETMLRDGLPTYEGLTLHLLPRERIFALVAPDTTRFRYIFPEMAALIERIEGEKPPPQPPPKVERRHPERSDVISRSLPMKELVERASRLAKTEMSILLTGESGVGKEVMARFIHEESLRRDGPFVAINCAAFPESLIEAELFGVEKGAATETSPRKGKFEMAQGGTLFLDEISAMSLNTQPKVLRAIQFKEFYSLGGNHLKKVDVRILSASNQVLQDAIDQGSFRPDLFYRISAEDLMIPPLRERREDIPPLVDHFMTFYSEKYGKSIAGISSKALRHLLNYPFPGNIRELENEIERAIVLCDPGDLIREKHLRRRVVTPSSLSALPPNSEEWELRRVLEEVESRHILTAMEVFKRRKSEVAQHLGISRTTLDLKLRKYGLDETAEE